jgi:hypothetical protein
MEKPDKLLGGTGTFTANHADTTGGPITFSAADGTTGTITGTVADDKGSVLTLASSANLTVKAAASSATGVTLSAAVVDVSAAGTITIGGGGVLTLDNTSTQGEPGGIFLAAANEKKAAVRKYVTNGTRTNSGTAADLATIDTTDGWYTTDANKGFITGAENADGNGNVAGATITTSSTLEANANSNATDASVNAVIVGAAKDGA